MSDEFELKKDALDLNDPSKKRSFGFNYLKLPEGIKFFTPRENEIEIIRLITFPGEGTFSKLVQAHYSVGGNNTVLCPAMFGDHCPLCQIKSDLYAAKKDKEASKFYPSKRSLVYVIDRSHEEVGPQVFGLSQTAMGLLSNLIKNLKDGVITNNVGHPEKGQDIVIKRYKKGAEKFAQVHDLQLDQEGSTPLSRDPKQLKDWVTIVAAYPIAGMLTRSTGEEIQEMMQKGSSGSDFYGQTESEETTTTTTGTVEALKPTGAVATPAVTVKTASKPPETTSPVTTTETTPVAEAKADMSSVLEQAKAKLAAMRA